MREFTTISDQEQSRMVLDQLSNFSPEALEKALKSEDIPNIEPSEMLTLLSNLERTLLANSVQLLAGTVTADQVAESEARVDAVRSKIEAEGIDIPDPNPPMPAVGTPVRRGTAEQPAVTGSDPV